MSVTPESENGEILLGVLTAVQEDDSLTQRSVADRVGIALGLANAVLKRCVTKGLIKVSQAPANRYKYYLTPKGFAEKANLTREFLRQSFKLFRAAREEYAELMAEASQRGARTAVLCGKSDLTDVAFLSAQTASIAPVAVVDDDHAGETYFGLTIVAWAQAPDADVAVICDMNAAQASYETAIGRYGRSRTQGPKLLDLADPAAAGLAEGGT